MLSPNLRTQEAPPRIHDNEICGINLNTINKVDLMQELKHFGCGGV